MRDETFGKIESGKGDDERRVEDMLRRQNEFLQALQDSTYDLVSETDLQKLLINIVLRAGKLLGTTSGYIDLLLSGGKQLTPTVALGILAEESSKFKVRRGEGLTGKVWESGKPIIIHDYDAWTGRISKHKTGLISSIMAVPMIAKGGIVGVMGVARDKSSGDSFDEESVEHLIQFARIAAIAIENAQLHETIIEELDERKEEILERRKAEKALRERETRFRALIEGSADGVSIVDVNARLLYTSGSIKRLLGYAPEAVVGKDMFDLIHPEDARITRSIFNRLVQTPGGSDSAMFRFTHQDGGWRWIEASGTNMLHDPAVGGIILNYRDISDRVKADNALRESEQRFLTVFRNSPIAIIISSVVDNSIVDVNDVFLRDTGYSLDEVIGNSTEGLNIFVDKADRERVVKEVRAQGFAYGLEMSFRIKNGSILTCLVSTGIVRLHGDPHFLSLIVDITERKRAEKILNESERRFREMLETVDLIAMTLDVDGTITFANDYLLRLTGWEREELIGSNWFENFVPGQDELKSLFIESLASGTMPSHLENPIVTKDGRLRDIVWNNTMLRSPAGNILGTASIGEDITDRRQGEQALNESKRRISDALEFNKKILGTSSVGILTYNASGQCTFANEAAAHIAGSSVAAMLNQNYHQLDAWKRGGLYASALEALRSGSEQQLETKSVTSFGKPGWFQLKFSTFQAEGEQHLLVFMQDVTEQKTAEAARAERERRFSTLFTLSPAGILLSDSTGRILEVNDTLCKTFGYTNEELIGKDLRMLVPLEYHDQVEGHIAEILSGCVLQHEVVNVGKGGTVHHVELRETSIPLPGGTTGILSVSTDISERKRAAEALRESDRRLATLMANLPGMAYRCKNDPQWSMQFVSEGCLGLTGYAPSDLSQNTNLSYQDIILPDDREMVRDGVQAALQKKVPFQLIYRIVAADSRVKWVWEKGEGIFDGRGELLFLEGFITDISERKQAEEALRASEEQFRLISENVADMITVLDLDGKRVYNSPSYEMILGDVASLKGTDSFRDIHPDDRETMRQIFRETVSTGSSHSIEYRVIGKDGAVHFIESTGSVIRGSEGNVTNVVRVGRDVTERKLLEHQSFRTQRLESIGTLASGVSHDLNNVLGPILLAIEVLKKYINDKTGLAVLDTLAVSALRGSDIVKQILGFARGMDGERTVLQPRHLVLETIKITGETFPKNITMKPSVPKDTWTITGDGTQFQQVVLNLCVNARDAMASGGTLSISVENTMLDSLDVIGRAGVKPGKYVLLTVADTGSGIPPELLDRVFEPFFTTKERGKGTGLGLSTVHGIVKSHGGFIVLNSEVDTGTTFRVYFPAGETDVIEAAAEDPRSLLKGNGEVILVIDDEESILEITRQTLELYNYSVVTARNGMEGVEAYRLRGSEIAVVVTDMMMPKLDGYQAVHFLRLLNKDVTIIGCSGLVTDDHLHTDIIATLDEFIPKPYKAARLLEAIAKVLRGKSGKAA